MTFYATAEGCPTEGPFATEAEALKAAVEMGRWRWGGCIRLCTRPTTRRRHDLQVERI